MDPSLFSSRTTLFGNVNPVKQPSPIQNLTLGIYDVVTKKEGIWLFGLNEDWKKGGGKKRSYAVKILFEPFMVYTGPKEQEEILKIRNVSRVEYDSFFPQCGFNNNASVPGCRVYYLHPGDKWNVKKSLLRPSKGEIQGESQIYNADIDPFVMLSHQTGVELWRTCEIKNYRPVANKSTICDQEIMVFATDIKGTPDGLMTSKPIILDFDIETLSRLPCPGHMDDDYVAQPEKHQVITICANRYMKGSATEERETYVFSLGSLSDWKGRPPKTYECKTESQLIANFRKLVQTVDVVCGWNSILFDLHYLFRRGQVLGRKDLQNWSKFKDEVCQVTKKYSKDDMDDDGVEGGSSKMKSNEPDYFILTPGLVQYDAMEACKIATVSKKLESYKLNFVGNLYLNQKKIDMPWEQIEPCFLDGPEGRAKIAEYCVQDVHLVSEVSKKKDYMTTVMGLSNMCHLPFTLILMRGQQLKVYQPMSLVVLQEKYLTNKEELMNSMKNFKVIKTIVESTQAEKKRSKQPRQTNSITSHFMTRDGRKIDTPMMPKKKQRRVTTTKAYSQRTFTGEIHHVKAKRPSRKKAYDGGYVIEPNPGFYHNVSVLDYAALYPSIIIAYNLCYRSLVMDESEAKRLIASGRELYEFKQVDGSGNTSAYCAFVMDYEHTMLPTVLRRLLNERSSVKKQMFAAEKAGDTDRYNILNARQLAIKITCNSVYGFTGADTETGRMPCQPIAVTITYLGRHLLTNLKKHVETKYAGRYRVIYGDTDSIFVQFLLKGIGHQQIIHEMETLAAELTALPMHREYLELEFESLFFNLIQFGKKKYAGGKFFVDKTEPKGWKLKPYYRGVAAIRRDTCNWAQQVLKTFFTSMIIDGNDFDKCLLIMKKTLSSVMECDLFDLSITRKINKTYKSENNVQCKVAKEIRERLGSYDAVKPGDRIRYIMRTGVQSKSSSDWGIDYEHAQNTNVRPRYTFYLGQVRKTLRDMCKMLGNHKLQKFDRIYSQVLGNAQRIDNGVSDLRNCFKRTLNTT